MSEHYQHEMHFNSLEAHTEERDSGRMRKRAAAIYTVYVAKGRALIDREVMEALGFTDMNSVRPRITELVKSGILRECGKKRDPVSRHKCRLVEKA